MTIQSAFPAFAAAVEADTINVELNGTRFHGVTLRDRRRLFECIGAPNFAEADYDKVLSAVSEHGFWLGTEWEDEEV